MTELAETIAIGLITEEDAECPFNHDDDTPPNVENKLIGVGSTLNSSMKKSPPNSTYLFGDLREQYQLKDTDSKSNPRQDDEGPFKSPKTPIEVVFPRGRTMLGSPDPKRSFKINEEIENVMQTQVSDGAGGFITLPREEYELSVAAHHAIPAQETLKRCNALLAYMVKKGEPGKLKDKEFTKGLVWANVGYDINGTQNGVYLPGNYAVGGGKGGMKTWKPNDSDDEEGQDEPALNPDGIALLLGGSTGKLNVYNTCWQYVKRAVELTKGQFHDRHRPYSDFVLKSLNQIAQDIQKADPTVYKGDCQKCKDRMDKIDEVGVPTDHRLVTKLNTLSSRLMQYLKAGNWHQEIYTSQWMNTYMEKVHFKDSGST